MKHHVVNAKRNREHGRRIMNTGVHSFLLIPRDSCNDPGVLLAAQRCDENVLFSFYQLWQSDHCTDPQPHPYQGSPLYRSTYQGSPLYRSTYQGSPLYRSTYQGSPRSSLELGFETGTNIT